MSKTIIKDEDSPPDPVQALVLLFYRPPTDPDPESVLNVLLLPHNVVLDDVLHARNKRDRDERFIETFSHCELIPKQKYTLSTSPEDDSVLVQPTEAEFDEESYNNYFPSFQVNWEKNIKSIRLILRDTNSSRNVWERQVLLPSTGVRKSQRQSARSLPSNERLMDIRTSSLPHSHSVLSFSQIPSEKNKKVTKAKSLPDMLLKGSFEEFIPDITVDENEETYRFHCTGPGLHWCTLTGLVFHMEGEGDVVYRIVPWKHRLLAQHHKKPAGPLFDIKCLQESVCQLHLPHCEIHSTGGCKFLSVAHVIDEGVEYITPHKITETHVIINITGFSGFGNVKDEDSPPDPVRALVLLFYRPPTDPESVLNVLLLPHNVVLDDVLHARNKRDRDERFIETPPYCELIPKQEYTLSTSTEDDSVLLQPKKAKFYEESYDNYFPSFQVKFKQILKSIQLFLIDTNSSSNVWDSEVFLPSTRVRNSQRQISLSSPSNERLMDIRTCFIDGISGPVLKSLLDNLFGKKVITDSERESAEDMQNKRDKARFVIDTVRKKGEAASSEMIEFLCEVDPVLCEHLGLIEPQ